MAYLPAQGESVLVDDGDDLVIDLGVQHLGHEARADALNLVGPGHTGGQHRRAFRLHRRHPDGGVPGLQILPHAGDGAAGAHTGHEPIHLPVGILPDLRPGGLKVGLGVGGVDELAGDEAAGNLPGQLLGLGNGPPHALGPLSEHQLRTIGLHQLAALHAHGFRHDDDHPGRRPRRPGRCRCCRRWAR